MARKRDLKNVDDVARQFGMSPVKRFEFRMFLEKCKRSGERGTLNERGDYTRAELEATAREFLDVQE